MNTKFKTHANLRLSWLAAFLVLFLPGLNDAHGLPLPYGQDLESETPGGWLDRIKSASKRLDRGAQAPMSQRPLAERTHRWLN